MASLISALGDRLSALERTQALPLGPTTHPLMNGGASSVTFTASSSSADVTIAHGLGSTPTAVKLTTHGVGAGMALISRDATNIVIRGFITAGTTATGSIAFDWEATL